MKPTDLQRWLGVTRVARLTGLDRTGIEVAAAVRPDGHVLQVTNGKGGDFAQASASALSEAAELWAAEHVDPGALQWDREVGMRRAYGAEAVWGLDALGSAGEFDLPDSEGLDLQSLWCAWRPARELVSGAAVWIPAQALHCLPENQFSLGLQVVRWTTNGMAAHPRREGAIRHALLEAVERDQLARTLPDGWVESVMRQRRLDVLASKPLATAEAQLRQRGFEVFWFDLTPTRAQGGVGLPVAAVLLWDQDEGPIPITAGYACAESPTRALLAALHEAAQSRLTDIHGAREDVEAMDRTDAAQLVAWCRQSVLRRRPAQMSKGVASRGVGALVQQLRRHGHPQVAVAELGPADAPLHVVKVVVPTFQVSALL
jgi:ribosomal protein S12 methylthiotransferase accessory factor